MKAPLTEINATLKKQFLKTFAQLLADLKDPKEAETFLTGFFNPEELDEYSRRLAVLYWLRKKRTPENIKTNIRVSQKTIEEVKKSENKPGMKLAIKKLEAEEFANVWAERIKSVVRK